LLQLLAGEGLEHSEITVPTQLVLRESVASPPLIEAVKERA
jgi:DNA-binding LacI/PurR family transcriptional regulator